MPVSPMLRGNRNQCRGCNELFNSNGAFAKHRTGEFGVNRRCMTATEMTEAGMVKRADGFWITEPMKGYKEGSDVCADS